MVIEAPPIDVLGLLKCDTLSVEARNGKLFTIPQEWPDIYVVKNFIGGFLRTRGKDEGQYPMPYLEMIESIFGREPETLEVCSRHVKADGISTKWTVDMNPDFNPTFCTNAETLAGVPSNLCKRVRMDPPYNAKTAKEMYGCDLPDFFKMLSAAARVLKVGGLIFMLLGPDNYQINVDRLGLRRIGLIGISVVPNYELRKCEVYAKIDEAIPDGEVYEYRALNVFTKYADKMAEKGQTALSAFEQPAT